MRSILKVNPQTGHTTLLCNCLSVPASVGRYMREQAFRDSMRLKHKLMLVEMSNLKGTGDTVNPDEYTVIQQEK